jgi:cytochrome c peroxidase
MGRALGLVAILALFTGLSACIPPETECETPMPVTIEVNHPGFPKVPEHPENQLTDKGIALGRKLYYDPILHPEGKQSCSSCHLQEKSFSSDAIVLPHVNLGFDHLYLWNGSIQGSIEDAMMFEVNEFFKTDLAKLNASTDYMALFKDAFCVGQIESKHVAYALAQFFKTMNSYNAKYDQYIRKETTLTTEERRGELIFFSELGDCFHCHSAPLFKDNLVHNTGLMVEYPTEHDKGYYVVTKNPADLGKFKTPTLRNVALTGPYMHDGRFETLEEVIDFYSYGVINQDNIDPLMKQAHKGGVALDPDDMAALLAFLHTLTDESFLTNPDLSRP